MVGVLQDNFRAVCQTPYLRAAVPDACKPVLLGMPASEDSHMFGTRGVPQIDVGLPLVFHDSERYPWLLELD